MNEDFIDSFLSEVEQEAIRKVADSKVTFEALKKCVLADVYYKGTLRKDVPSDPTRNAALAFAFSGQATSNEQIGEDVRALAEGVRLVEGGFSRVEKFKSQGRPVEKPRKNGR